jgi:hypothetical protein
VSRETGLQTLKSRDQGKIRLVGVFGACVLLLLALSWFLRRHAQARSDWSWIVPLTLVLQLTATANSWFRFRRVRSVRSWLILQVIGNLILTIGLVAVWFYDLALPYYVVMLLAVFAAWILRKWKLRHIVQENKHES